jgi:hypothetical protein
VIPRWKHPKWREYQNTWKRRVYRERREEYFADKVCIDCGAGSFLEVDHVDKKQKVTHKIWLWSKERREKELAKCVVRCDSCHNRRHGEERRKQDVERSVLR